MSPTVPSLSATDIVVSARGVVKTFGPTRALRGVDFKLRRGEIHALLGGNGAGKSTLIKILSGQLAADAGQVDHDVASIAVVHQELALFKDLTVAENIELGSAKGLALFPWRRGAETAAQILAMLGIHHTVDADDQVGSLPLHKQQLVEIGRALASGASVILLDEPTAALTSTETKRFFGVLERVREGGISFIFVSHRMQEIRQIADRMTIIRDGVTVVDAREITEITDAEVLTEMFGQAVDREPRVRTSESSTGSAVATLTRGDVTITVHEGEIVGLSGVPIGPQAAINTLLGRQSDIAWDAFLIERGTPRRITNPRAAIQHGIGYVSGDRMGKGIFPALTIYENILIPRQIAQRRTIRRTRDHDIVDRLAEQLDFSNQNLDREPQSLSGGTQQKALITRWLDLDVKLLILEEPTRGVDLKTKNDLYDIIEELVARGCAVIWWSTEFSELKQACDRVLVFDVSGDPVDLIPMSELSEEALLDMTGTA